MSSVNDLDRQAASELVLNLAMGRAAHHQQPLQHRKSTRHQHGLSRRRGRDDSDEDDDDSGSNEASEASEGLPPGASLADFGPLKQLGQGSFGAVFRCRSLVDEEEYVLKRIRVKHLSVAQQRAAVSEVLILKRVHHPHVVRFVSSFLDGNSLYLVMELAEGGDLHTLLERVRTAKRHLREAVVWEYFAQLCQAVHYLHQQKIIHRDIKTMNVLLGRMNTIKLGDLGVSRLLVSQNVGRGLNSAGTPLYNAPELFQHKPYGTEADVWSLGCVLYTMAALRTPFYSEDPEVLAKLVVAGEYPDLPDYYSPLLHETVRSMLSKRPKDRPSLKELFSQIPLPFRHMSAMNKLFDADMSRGIDAWGDFLSLPDSYLARPKVVNSMRPYMMPSSIASRVVTMLSDSEWRVFCHAWNPLATKAIGSHAIAQAQAKAAAELQRKQSRHSSGKLNAVVIDNSANNIAHANKTPPVRRRRSLTTTKNGVSTKWVPPAQSTNVVMANKTFSLTLSSGDDSSAEPSPQTTPVASAASTSTIGLSPVHATRHRKSLILASTSSRAKSSSSRRRRSTKPKVHNLDTLCSLE